MASKNVVDVVIFAEISRELPFSSVGYSKDGGGVFNRDSTNHFTVSPCILIH